MSRVSQNIFHWTVVLFEEQAPWQRFRNLPYSVSMLENQRASSPINCTEQPCNVIFYGLILFNPGLNCLAQKLKKERTVPTVLWSQITWMVHYRRKKKCISFSISFSSKLAVLHFANNNVKENPCHNVPSGNCRMDTKASNEWK